MINGYLGNTNLKKINEDIAFTPEHLKEYMTCMKDPI